MTKYEYQVLESDACAVPVPLMNEQGEMGWKLVGIVKREPRDPAEPIPEGGYRWMFYFVREKQENA